MSPDELLLRDIHLPAPVSWWPPAPGWWLLAAALVVFFVLAAWCRRRRIRIRNAPATLARLELERLTSLWRENGDAQQAIADASTWLRRAGMSMATRRQAASLTGTRWRKFLDELAGERVFDEAVGRLVTEAPYRPGTNDVRAPDVESLLGACQRWLGAASRRAGRS